MFLWHGQTHSTLTHTPGTCVSHALWVVAQCATPHTGMRLVVETRESKRVMLAIHYCVDMCVA